MTKQEQAHTRLREMSAPIVTVRDGVLLLPLVGPVDSVREEEIMKAIL